MSDSEASGKESDIEIRSVVLKKKKRSKPVNTYTHELLSESDQDSESKPEKNKPTKYIAPAPLAQDLLVEAKKVPIKEMVYEALEDLNTKKGVSYYAIKKYMTEKHNVDINKIGYYIKKHLKTGVENGAIVQTKGIGISGSFKLAPKKKATKAETKPKKKEMTKTLEKTKEKLKIKAKPEAGVTKTKKTEEKNVKSIKAAPKEKTIQKEKKKEKSSKKEEDKKPVNKVKKQVKLTAKTMDSPKMTKIAKEIKKKTGKSKSLVRKKSIGSIIKTPKMKPKSKA